MWTICVEEKTFILLITAYLSIFNRKVHYTSYFISIFTVKAGLYTSH